MSTVRILTDISLTSNIMFESNLLDFPANPSPRTIVVKDSILYIFSELVPGEGFYTWIPISVGQQRASYLHTQSEPSSLWTIPHHFNSYDFAYFVYDENHSMILANINVVDADTCELVLSSAMSGKAVLFSLQYLNSTTVETNQLMLNGGTLSVSYNDLLFNGTQIATKNYVNGENFVMGSRILAETDRATIAETSLQTNIDALTTQITSLESSLSSLSTSESSIASQISGIDSQITSLSASTASISTVNTLSAQLSTLSSQVTSLESQIAQLQANTISFASITNKPTTLAGYGIVDALSIAGGTMTGNINMNHHNLSHVSVTDSADTFHDNGSSSQLDFYNGGHQKWSPTSDASLTIINWPPVGYTGTIVVEGVNLGAHTIQFPNVQWITADGSVATSLSTYGVTLQSSGSDWIVLWSSDAGNTIHGKIIR